VATCLSILRCSSIRHILYYSYTIYDMSRSIYLISITRIIYQGLVSTFDKVLLIVDLTLFTQNWQDLSVKVYRYKLSLGIIIVLISRHISPLLTKRSLRIPRSSIWRYYHAFKTFSTASTTEISGGSKPSAELNCWESIPLLNLMYLTPFPFVKVNLHLAKRGKGNNRPDYPRIQSYAIPNYSFTIVLFGSNCNDLTKQISF
jgi:hypothetical protein